MSADSDAYDPFAPGPDDLDEDDSQTVARYLDKWELENLVVRPPYFRAKSNGSRSQVKYEGVNYSMTDQVYGVLSSIANNYKPYRGNKQLVMRHAIVVLGKALSVFSAQVSPALEDSVRRAEAEYNHEWYMGHIAYHKDTVARIEELYRSTKDASAEMRMVAEMHAEEQAKTLEYPEYIAQAEEIRRRYKNA